LRDDKRKNKKILQYLNEENEYSKHWFKVNNVNSKKIFNNLKNSLPKYEESLKTKLDEYEYFSTQSLAQEYRKYFRIIKNRKN
jgi:oligopeptidase B